MLLVCIVPCSSLLILKLQHITITFYLATWNQLCDLKSLLVSFEFTKALTSVGFSFHSPKRLLLLLLLLQTLTSLYCMNEKQQRAPFLPPLSFSFLLLHISKWGIDITLCFDTTHKNINEGMCISWRCMLFTESFTSCEHLDCRWQLSIQNFIYILSDYRWKYWNLSFLILLSHRNCEQNFWTHSVSILTNTLSILICGVKARSIKNWHFYFRKLGENWIW